MLSFFKAFFRKAKEIQGINMLMKNRATQSSFEYKSENLKSLFSLGGKRFTDSHIEKPNFQYITVTCKITQNKMLLLICSCYMVLLEIENIQFFFCEEGNT